MVLTKVNGQNETIQNDQIEELHYGPGIVSKLRCRYMSLTLNQNNIKQRPSLDFLRRSTSLNNLISIAQTRDFSFFNNPIEESNNLHKINSNALEKSDKNTTYYQPAGYINHEKPPADMVRQKLKIFEPKDKCFKSQSNTVNNVQKNEFESRKTQNITQNNSNDEKYEPLFEIEQKCKSKSRLNECHLKTSKSILHGASQSIVYNFSRRQSIPSYLPANKLSFIPVLKIKFNDILTSTFEYPSEKYLNDQQIFTNGEIMEGKKISIPTRMVLLVPNNEKTEQTISQKDINKETQSYWSDETHTTDILF
uniref:CSON013246 protein n=1 Tax=Culicoides sonorensis TaxID=179676 RepID=A0A336KS53_CULSO